MSNINYLNGVFNIAQTRAIEKYVADFVASVLKSYEAGPIEVKVAPKAAKVVKEPDTTAE